MITIDEFNPKPAPDYETLLFQFRSAIRLYNATSNQCSVMAKIICDMQKKIADGALDAVESERAATALGTAELEALRQERDGLRADAVRYRWLRHGDNDELVFVQGTAWLARNEDLDAAIDAAMAKEQGDGA